MKTYSRFFIFLIGSSVGFCIPLLMFFQLQHDPSKNVIKNHFRKLHSVVSNNLKSSVISPNNDDFYNSSVAEDLFDKVRIVCWILTYSENHESEAIHVKNTWGKRCNKLIFISDIDDKNLGSVAVPVENGRDFLWEKTKHAFLYVYEHHLQDGDWFLKADDDNYVFIENLRYMLYQYRPDTSLYVGHRFAMSQIPEGYMSGGGYVLSTKAVEKFVTQALSNSSICNVQPEGNEDLELGICLRHIALLVDDRDEFEEKRFFCVNIMEQFEKTRNMDYWYYQRLWYNYTQGSLKCCSQYPVALHYSTPMEMYFLDYLTRQVHPFGLDKHVDDTLPRKFTFNEVLAKSDSISKAVLFRNHSNVHFFDHDEKYRR